MIVLLFLCILNLICLSRAESVCESLSTCSDCIGHEDVCVWCPVEKHKSSRCSSRQLALSNTTWCPNLYEDSHSSVNIGLNQSLNDKSEEGKVVQIAPQVVNITARAGDTVNFTISYKPVDDYPIDLYFLMDDSYSMKAYRELLRNQADNITKTLLDVSKNVRFGIGAFIDKPSLPIARKDQNAYSYKNILSLTDDIFRLKEALARDPQSSNLDDPEGGLDALMQTMVCDEVGWRDDARRIIVLFTESPYHCVGDGRYVGAIHPNDMQCHLIDNTYSEALTQDYPSTGQINRAAVQGNFKIIFAVEEEVLTVYKALAEQIQGAEAIELHSQSNLAVSIKDEYLKSIRSVQIDLLVPPYFEVILNPPCDQRNHKHCKLTHRETKLIDVSIKMRACPKELEDIDNTIKIKPFELDEAIVVNVEAYCECECQKYSVKNSTYCDNGGIFECGVCRCQKNSYGDRCSCLGSSSNENDLEKCKVSSKDVFICSGRGKCMCGKCVECIKSSGKFCEYDDEACLRPNNKLCSHNGECYEGRCHCIEKWEGDDCSCPTFNTDCIDPYSDKVCAGNGDCVCGQCVCKQNEHTNETYTGKFCDFCSQCTEKKCEQLADYVECIHEKGKVVCNEVFNQTSDTEITVVQKSDFGSADWQHAKFYRKNKENGDLLYKCKYSGSSRRLQIVIQKELEVPDKLNLLVIIGSAVGSIVFIGLLTAGFWKILIDMYDGREYERFVQECSAAGFDTSLDNPLYEKPSTYFSNPSYRPS